VGVQTSVAELGLPSAECRGCGQNISDDPGPFIKEELVFENEVAEGEYIEDEEEEYDYSNCDEHSLKRIKLDGTDADTAGTSTNVAGHSQQSLLVSNGKESLWDHWM
jgi:hypothetical protein